MAKNKSQKRSIKIEITCYDKTCGNCKYKARMSGEYIHYFKCDLFCAMLEESRRGVMRCDKCLENEQTVCIPKNELKSVMKLFGI